jgi:hypothetical protein
VAFDFGANVGVVTHDSLIKHYGMPRYIKINVEGYEGTVLDGFSIQPPLISIEYHGANLKGAIGCLGKPTFAEDSLFNLTDESGTQFQCSKWGPA